MKQRRARVKWDYPRMTTINARLTIIHARQNLIHARVTIIHARETDFQALGPRVYACKSTLAAR